MPQHTHPEAPRRAIRPTSLPARPAQQRPARAQSVLTLVALGSVALATLAKPLAAQSPLDDYVRDGLRQNLAIRQQALQVQRADASLREARGNFLPSATLNARYTNVSGRVVNLGELINPAFAALNQLLGSPQFPTDIDLRLPLKQETAVRVAQPIFQAEIYAGYRAASAARQVQEATFDAAERQLASEIRSGYLNYAKALRLQELRVATRELLEEQVRVISRLVEAGRATPDALSRARAELSETQQRESEAQQLVDASRQSFNLTVGRAIDDSVTMIAPERLALDGLPALEDALRSALNDREELRALDAGKRAADAQASVARGSYLPNLAVALDYGVQGNEYRFRRDSDFTLVSVVASWNLFNGGRDAARVQQAQLDAERIALQGQDARRGIELQVRLAWQAAAVAKQAIETATAQESAADRTFQLVSRRYEEGLASPLELSEARVQRTAAQLNAVFTTYDYYLRRVELDRAAALYPRDGQ